MRSFTLSILIVSMLFVACFTRSEPPPANQHIAARRESGQPCININTATVEELMELPGVGEVMSRKIVEHRKLRGTFRRPQDLIIIEGFSENKFRTLAERICVE